MTESLLRCSKVRDLLYTGVLLDDLISCPVTGASFFVKTLGKMFCPFVLVLTFWPSLL